MRPIDIGTKVHTQETENAEDAYQLLSKGQWTLAQTPSTGPILCVQEVGIVSRLKISPEEEIDHEDGP